ncbi:MULTISPECIES: LysR family transcriptional regulator [Streptosporangium]|uniref:DNA-binding transcriptional LysR family regulator n=1 Tax=Streptosporangium brasiliense TaxID=47480 RepID=A0ABT9RKX7_9ACTN|nr:LysR family transcriptional regulator [Streptosporangium brasiliense]MDP9869466.1 DNA-binding transcriptional LysR family regulator [Streptosporangium brasiliense]
MERRDIEIFLTLAEELHFARTAERLGVSGARVSQTIKQLERRFGVALFQRTSRQVTLTPVGSALREDVQAGYQRIQEGIAKAIAAGRGFSGILRVGFSSPLVGEAIMAAAEAFRTRHPDCEVRIREVHLSDAFGALRTDELDLQVTELPVQETDLSSGPALLRDPRVLAVSSGHPFARRDSVTVEDLARDTVLVPADAPEYLLDALIPAQAPSGRPIQREQILTSRQELLTLVSGGAGMAVVGSQATRYHARPDIVYVPIADLPPIEYGPVWPVGGQTSRVRSFTTLLRAELDR